MTPLLILLCAQSDAEWAQRAQQAAVPLLEALAKGIREAGDGVPVRVTLERDKDSLVYSVDVAQGETSRTISIDASGGKILGFVVRGRDHSAAIQAARIGLKQAIEAAVKQSGGTVVEAELSLIDRKPIFTVRIVKDGKVATHRISGESGEPGAAPAKPDPLEERLKKDKLGYSEALTRALKEAKEGTLYQVKREPWRGSVTYDVRIAQDSGSRSVVIDAVSGKVLENLAARTPANLPRLGKIGIPEAIRAALEKAGGEFFEAFLVTRAGKTFVVVKVIQSGEERTRLVDGTTGEVLLPEPKPPPKEPGQ